MLARLAREPRGTRIVDGSRNLPMLVGLEPISAYRTLDLPALEPLNVLARGPLGAERSGASVRKALRATGRGSAGSRSGRGRPGTTAGSLEGPTESAETIDDPNLAGWLFGPAWRAEQGSWASRFRIVHPQPDASRAWFLPLTEVDPSGHAGLVGRRRRARSRALRPGPAAEAGDTPLRTARTWPLTPRRPAGSSSPSLPIPSGRPAGRMRPVRSFRRKSCRRSGGARATAAGSGFGFPVRGGGRSTWSTRLATSERDWSSRPWPGWPGESRCAMIVPATEEEARVSGQVGVAIVGASGYAALELIRILLNHPRVAITAATSRQDESPRLDTLHPSLTRRIDLACETFDADRIADRARFAFLALPHTASMAVVPDLAGARRPRDRPERRLPPDRPPGLRRLVRPQAHRPRRPEGAPSTACRSCFATGSRRPR